MHRLLLPLLLALSLFSLSPALADAGVALRVAAAKPAAPDQGDAPAQAQSAPKSEQGDKPAGENGEEPAAAPPTAEAPAAESGAGDQAAPAEGRTAPAEGGPPASPEAGAQGEAAAPGAEPPPAAPSEGAAMRPFSYDDVVQRARALAAEPFQAPQADLPEALENAQYDTYREIEFRRDRALWRDEAMFQVQFFHLGFLYQQPVRINVVDGGTASEVMFDPTMFNYRNSGLEDDVAGVSGFAGFKLLFALNAPDKFDEVTVFLGASYFRLLGRDQVFGASVRGLAVDTAMPRGEEFPFFREFWLVKPRPNDLTLTIYALLDSQRVSGAYQFIIDPGTATVVDVRSTVFAREDMDKVGIAPLTSMYLFGEPRMRTFDDFRPEVHDSDGLMMLTGAGDWIWRPLANGRELKVSAFQDENPRGFGLLQRDRNFHNYLDLEALYDRRPGLWVEPRGDWGKGAVELVEIPSDQEIHDNIVAYWVSATPWEAGQSREFHYRVYAISEMPFRVPLAQAVRTRIGSPIIPGQQNNFPPDARLIVVDFGGDDLPYLSGTQPVTAEIWTNKGRIIDQAVSRIPQEGGWRVAFRVDPEGSADIDMTLKLKLYDRPIAETWSYRWSR